MEGVTEEASRGADRRWAEGRDPDSAAARAGGSPLHLGRAVSLTWRSALGVSLKFPSSVITWAREMSNFAEPSEPLVCYFKSVVLGRSPCVMLYSVFKGRFIGSIAFERHRVIVWWGQASGILTV